MNCPNCATTNPEGAKFCFNCGTPLSLRCPNCSTELPAGVKFCFNCGHKMDAAAPSAAPTTEPAPASSADAALNRFIPAELLSRLQSARATRAMEGERRIVTMLFCDVKGSTAAASQMDPEEWAEIINGAYEYMIRPIYQYEGTVARLLGDGLLAFFGAPIAHEDDPERAVLAGLGILEGVDQYKEVVRKRWGLDFSVRVGVNTGLVVVGAMGSDLRMEYTALGDAINMAARMEQTAVPGTVQISAATHKLVAPLFEFETVSGLEVKGKADPVTAYRVLGRKAERGAMRGLVGLRSPLVGRDMEVREMRKAFAELQTGRGAIISVMGEAGLGKSRLIAELRDELLADPESRLRWLAGRSYSYETESSYAPFVRVLRSYFGLQHEGADAGDFDGVAERLHELVGEGAAEMSAFVASVLGLEMPPDVHERVKYLDPLMLRALTFDQLAGLFEAISSESPLILYLDDVHWIDPTSQALLESLLPLTERSNLMILMAFRPRRHEPSWGLHEKASHEYAHRYTTLALQPLDNEQARQLVGNLLEIEDLPASVRQLILDKADGNPFFVEEVIRSLLDAGLVVRVDGHWRATREIANIAFPDTLVGVITARLDHLGDRAKSIVQAASVLGREFNFEILMELIEDRSDIEAQLSEIQRREIVRERSREPERVFTFKHVLTQEAAYASILLSHRRELHLKAARTLTIRQPDRLADIARHFLDARQPGQALPYLVHAGEKAARAYAIPEATGFFRKAIELQESASDFGFVRRAYEGQGNAYEMAYDFPPALQAYQELLALAEEAGDIPGQVSALNKAAAVLALQMGQFQEAETFLQRAERLGNAHQVVAGIAELSVIRCQMCTAQAEFDTVVEYMDDLVDIGTELESPEYVAMAMHHIANSLMLLGRFDEALLKADEGLSVARDIGDRMHEADLLATTIPMALIARGRLAAAKASLDEGIGIAEKIKALFSLILGCWIRAELARWQGEYEKALSYGARSLEVALPLEQFLPFVVPLPLSTLGSVHLAISGKFADEAADFHRQAMRVLEMPGGAMSGSSPWADLGYCALMIGDFEMAENVFAKGVNMPNMFVYIERPRHLAGTALLAASRGAVDEASTLIGEARSYAEEKDMQHLMPLIALVAGRVHVAGGEWESALVELAKAEALALALGFRPIVWRARADSAHVLRALGRDHEAGDKMESALEMIDEIADLFQEPAFRAGFMANARSRAERASSLQGMDLAAAIA
ncbi:MAG: AAA family ATPase [Caldilineales bacterium]|nr:AAA family ATPase [Caldilineales bacterium]